MSERDLETFISVSGGVRAADQREFSEIIDSHMIPDIGYIGVWGVQANKTTQVGDIPSNWGADWHAVGDNIRHAGFADQSGRTKAFVHVASGTHPSSMLATYRSTLERTKEFVSGVQINLLPWSQMTGHHIKWLRQNHPGLRLILQASGKQLTRMTPQESADYIEQTTPDYVLFDPSGGLGVKLDLDSVRPFIDEVYQRQLPVGVVVAGGLSAETMEEVMAPLVSEYDGLSVDAEGRLRYGEKPHSVLDMEKVDDYVRMFATVVRRHAKVIHEAYE